MEEDPLGNALRSSDSSRLKEKYFARGPLFEGEAAFDEMQSDRGEEWSGFLQVLTAVLLRGGFLLQFTSIVLGYASFYINGGVGIFTFDLFSTPEKLRTDEYYASDLIVVGGIFLAGALAIAGFQIHLPDNSKASRGFRAGSKMLSTAATLDIFVVAFRLMQYIYAYRFLGERWWMKYAQTPADWCLFYSSAYLHSIALLLYGLAIFYMESYHDEGTSDEWGWLCLSLFSLASLSEVFLVFTRFGALTTIFQAAALLCALFWSCSFEPIVQRQAPTFHDRDLNSGIMGPFAEEDTYVVPK